MWCFFFSCVFVREQEYIEKGLETCPGGGGATATHAEWGRPDATATCYRIHLYEMPGTGKSAETGELAGGCVGWGAWGRRGVTAEWVWGLFLGWWNQTEVVTAQHSERAKYLRSVHFETVNFTLCGLRLHKNPIRQRLIWICNSDQNRYFILLQSEPRTRGQTTTNDPVQLLTHVSLRESCPFWKPQRDKKHR